MITIFMPVSRDYALDKAMSSIDMLIKPEDCSLLVLVDGDHNLYIKTRSMMPRGMQGLCIQSQIKGVSPRFSPHLRRKRIAQLHNEAKQYVQHNGMMLLTEDDTALPADALVKMLGHYKSDTGFVTGVQLGRWGAPYLGAWNLNDLCEPTEIVSQLPGDDYKSRIDASGFYCLLTSVNHWKDINHQPFDNGSFGPDINYGVQLRRLGFTNIIDWTIDCKHFLPNGKYVDVKAMSLTFKKIKTIWRQYHA